MKKLINKPEDFARETIEGIVLAHPESLKMVNNSWHCLVRADEKKEGKVAIATGGGSGHLPVFLGYVGYGLADGVTVGNVFASPSAEAMHEVDKAINSGAGVLHLYGRYGGDIMNFGMASDLDEMEDIPVKEVLVTDDIASAPKGSENKRRGVAGLVFAYKCAGAAAEKMYNLDEVARIAIIQEQWALLLHLVLFQKLVKLLSVLLKMKWKSVWVYMGNQVFIVLN